MSESSIPQRTTPGGSAPSRSIRRPNPWWVGVVCGLAGYIDAAAIVSTAIALVAYQTALRLDASVVGVVSGVLTLGIAIGAVAGGRLGDRFGRRSVFLVTMVVVVLGALILVLAGSEAPLVVGALLVGLGTGADLPVSLSTISEAATDRNRGKLIGLSQVLWVVGILAAVLLGVGVGALGRPGGQILFGHIALAALVVLLLRLTIPESQIWLDARAERRAGVATVRADRAKVRELFGRAYAVPFIALIVFITLVNLGANTLGQFGPFLLVSVAKTSLPTASLLSLALLPVGLLSGLLFVAVADGRVRFSLFRVGAVIYVVAFLIPAVAGFGVVTYLVSSVLFSFGAGVSTEALMRTWAQQSFPTLLRTTAQGAIIAVERLGAAVLALITPAIIGLGTGVLYGLLAALAAIGFAVAWIVFGGRDRHNEFDIEDRLERDVAAAPAAGA